MNGYFVSIHSFLCVFTTPSLHRGTDTYQGILRIREMQIFFALGTQMIICIYPPSLVYSIPHFEHTKGFYLKGHFIGYVLLLFISSWNALMSLVLYTYRIIILIRYAHLQYSIFNSIFNKNSF